MFTHPYTPQENRHKESFHSILGSSIDPIEMNTMEDLYQHLVIFYEKYNNDRLHSSIANLPPNIFTEQWENNNIIQCVDIDKKKAKFRLRIPYQEVFNTSGNESLGEASCLNYKSLDWTDNLDKQANGAKLLKQPSVQMATSVASC